MPNGYTAGVIDGDYDAADYVAHAARGFGIAIMQRDDGPGPVRRREVPEYFYQWLERDQKQLAEWLAKTPEEINAEYQEYVNGIILRNRANQQSAALVRERIEKVKAAMYATETPDDEQFKKMLETMHEWLDETMDWDANPHISTIVPYDEWVTGQNEMYARSVESSRRSLNEEIERAAEQNRYVDMLEEYIENLRNNA